MKLEFIPSFCPWTGLALISYSLKKINKKFNDNFPKGAFQCHVHTITELTVERLT